MIIKVAIAKMDLLVDFVNKIHVIILAISEENVILMAIAHVKKVLVENFVKIEL